MNGLARIPNPSHIDDRDAPHVGLDVHLFSMAFEAPRDTLRRTVFPKDNSNPVAAPPNDLVQRLGPETAAGQKSHHYCNTPRHSATQMLARRANESASEKAQKQIRVIR